MSLGLGQTASLEPVVKTVVNVGVRALAETAADSAKLTSETTRVLSLSNTVWSAVTSSRMFVNFLFKLLHECYRCELILD